MTGGLESFVVEPGQRVAGSVSVPGDKSISHRALMLGAIAEGQTRVHGFLESEDCLATLSAFRAMGVTITERAGALEIEGVGPHGLVAPAAALDLGNSGTAMRLLMGLLAGQSFGVTLTGDDSLRSRPMERVAAPLRSMGAAIETSSGRAPVRIAGGRKLAGIDYTLPVASAQIKSALLLATLYASGRTVVRSPGPSRDHTERMLEAMGAPVVADADTNVVELTGPCVLEGGVVEVPADLSSAAFFIVAACLGANGPLTIPNVGVNPTRTGILTALVAMGARIELVGSRKIGTEPVADIVVKRSSLIGIDLPPELVPLAIDELPVLFVAAAAARGRTIVRGAEELRHKEVDRIAVMARALAAVGVTVEETEDGIVIEGGRIRGGSIDSGGDHRIAMAFAVASPASEGAIAIGNTGPVATSFPGFVETAARAGLSIRVGTTAGA